MPMSLSSLKGLRQFHGRSFSMSDLAKALFHPQDIADWEANNPELLKKGSVLQEPQRVVELERRLTESLEDNKRLTQELERLKAVQSTTPTPTPKTSPATEAASAARAEEWKGFAAIMVKVAYECGKEGKTNVSRSSYEAMAQKHGVLRKSAIEVLRNALPEISQKRGGAPRQD